MNFQEIEKLRTELASFLPRIKGLPKVLVLFSFYEKILLTKDANLINAFALEFIEYYLSELESYSPFYSEPEKTQDLIDQLQLLKTHLVLVGYSQRINDIIGSLSNKLNNFYSILNGATDFTISKGELLYPLIGKLITSTDNISYSTIEKFKIRITPSKEKDSFIFIPSNQEELEEQAKICFQLALDYLKAFKTKFHKYHDVLIYFENLHAEYDGKSLGLVLTIGFIERLSYVYNLPYITYVKSNVASTGELDNDGNLISIGENNIVCKIESVFYSKIDTIVIPKTDEIPAIAKLKELNEKFPRRVLNIIPVENLTDILNRRNLVEIKKQSPIVRTAKGIKKNWIVSFLLLFLILTFVYLHEYDDNPYTYESTANEIIIKNRDDRALWNITFPNYDIHLQGIKSLDSSVRIIDINNDMKNEVLFTFVHPSKYSDDSISDGLVLLNYKGEIIWQRSFRKTLTSKRENLTPPFGTFIFDTLKINNELCILCGSNNANSYASAVYILDLKSNKVVSDTLWNPGHINDVRVVDLNNDEKKELLVLAANNGLQENSLYHLNIDELKGQVPTTDDYKLINVKDAHLLHYFVFPNTDYSKYMNQRYASVKRRSLEFDLESKMIRFLSSEAGLEKQCNVIYNWYYKKNDFDIAIGSDLRLMRDTLVAHGKLPLPYTDTKEYREILRKQIQAWDGVKFIPIDEYNKK